VYFKTALLSEIAIALRNNTLSLEDYIRDTCKRIKTVDAEVQSLLSEKGREKRLLKEAETLAAKYPNPGSRPPLFGVLLGVKDMFRADGFPTQAGSKLPPEEFAGAEATVVTRLKQAGALILGKTVSTEFAYFNPGPTKNPHNPEYTPGGSSSGSAAAVAAGLCPLALGTQTIASIVRPAAYCGVIGFKPSFGRIPTDGVIPFSQSADHIGFFTQDLNGATITAGILIEDWDFSIRSIPKPRICLPSDAFLVQADYDSFNRFYRKVDVLNDAGYEITNFPLFKEIKTINRIHRELIAAEFAINHKNLYKKFSSLYSEPSRELFEQGSKINNAALVADRAIQQTYKQSVNEIMHREGIDLWICPSTTTPAPKGLASTGNPLMSLPWTFTGLPSISLPAGKAANELPLGIQLVGGYGKDEHLLNYCNELSQLLSF
jgi:Asp-tRNA(Asn)/Glu-tRNA(Gln) amidotransferase A subunit family amidase